MTIRWLLAVPALALVLLGAHFWRSGSWLLVLAWAALIGGLAWPRAWVRRTARAGLLLGACEWPRTAAALVQERIALGQPWLHLASIIGAVTLLTIAAAALLQHPQLRAPRNAAGARSAMLHR